MGCSINPICCLATTNAVRSGNVVPCQSRSLAKSRRFMLAQIRWNRGASLSGLDALCMALWSGKRRACHPQGNLAPYAAFGFSLAIHPIYNPACLIWCCSTPTASERLFASVSSAAGIGFWSGSLCWRFAMTPPPNWAGTVSFRCFGGFESFPDGRSA